MCRFESPLYRIKLLPLIPLFLLLNALSLWLCPDLRYYILIHFLFSSLLLTISFASHPSAFTLSLDTLSPLNLNLKHYSARSCSFSFSFVSSPPNPNLYLPFFWLCPISPWLLFSVLALFRFFSSLFFHSAILLSVYYCVLSSFCSY